MEVGGAGKVVIASSKRPTSMVVSHGNITNIYGDTGDEGSGSLWFIEQTEPSSGHLILKNNGLSKEHVL